MLSITSNPDLEIAVNAVKLGSELLVKIKEEGVKINSSLNKDIKLEADVESEKVIINYLKANSSYDILTEESGAVVGNKDQPYCWIVDPLDGSLNYSRGIDIYCISLGLWHNNEPVLGVVYDFYHNKLYTGVVSEGAYCNGKKIEVSSIADKSQSIIATGFPVYSDFSSEALFTLISEIQTYKKVRLLGSAAMSLTLVAKGSVEAYAEDNIAIWDVAAGLAIVKAAGGVIKYTPRVSGNYLKVFASNSKMK